MMRAGMRVLVIGGTEFISLHLVRTLRARPVDFSFEDRLLAAPGT